jgi:hypothetical protein
MLKRARRGQVWETVQTNDLWIQARNFCTGACLSALDSRGAGFSTRQHESLPFEGVSALRPVGRIETGQVAEHRGQGWDAQGQAHLCRRIQVKRDPATRAGDRVLYILTNGPVRKASAKRVARFYRQRWTLETAFQHLAAYCHAAIPTLGDPKAALFGFCLALVADNLWAVVMAAWRSVQGATMDQELSLYEGANDLGHTDHGMMIAIPEEEWRVFRRMRPAEMVTTLRELAPQVCLKGYRKSPRGPKTPRPKREGTTKAPHVSTAKLLRHLKAHAATP